MSLFIGIIDIIDAKYPIDNYKPEFVDFSKGVKGVFNFICKENPKYSFSINLNPITKLNKISCFDCKKLKIKENPIGLTFDLELIINDKKVAEGRISLEKENFTSPKYYPLFDIPRSESRDSQVKLSFRYELPLTNEEEEEEEEENNEIEEEEESSEERLRKQNMPKRITLYGRYVAEEDENEKIKRRKEKQRHEQIMSDLFKQIFAAIDNWKEINDFYDNSYEVDRALHSATRSSVMQHLEGSYNRNPFDNDEPISEDDECAIPFNSIVYQIKGDMHPYIFRVPAHFSSLNHNDCFIVQTKDKIWLWIGKDANTREITKGKECFEKLFSYNQKIEKIILTKSEITPEFWRALGGTKKDNKENIPLNLGHDEIVERTFIRQLTEVETITTFKKIDNYSETSLSSNSVYVLHYGPSVSIYIGKNAPKELAINANEIAQNYLRQNSLPLWFPVSIIKEGTKGPELGFLFS